MRRNKKPSLLPRLLNPKSSLGIFAALLFTAYTVIPAYLYATNQSNQSNHASLTLSIITLVGIVFMAIGSRISLFDFRFQLGAKRLYISNRNFVYLTWGLFLAFIAVTTLTATSIPIMSAFSGASADDLSQQRGDFLKGREGIYSGLLYLSSFLTNTIVPYSIVLSYITRSRLRHVLALVFFIYCISFLQKALFLNLIFPLAAYFAFSRRYSDWVFTALIGGSALLLLVSVFLSLGGEPNLSSVASGSFFSASYIPTSSLDYLVWRAFSVPTFTAIDTLIVHREWLGGSSLLGSTSSLLASITGAERVNLERMVFEYQFGSWNEIANSNTVFLLDAYVNFHWAGVIAFGLFVGLVFRWFRISRDQAFKSLWPLFAFVLFSGPLIGTLLSNGFLYMLFHALFIRVGHHDRVLDSKNAILPVKFDSLKS